MKLILRLLLIVALTYLLPWVLPWWSVVLGAFVSGLLIRGNGFSVFISGFLGGGLVWMLFSWYVDLQTKSILSEKVVGLFPVEDKLFLIIASGLIGALCGGFGALSGSTFRDLFTKRKSKSFYS